MRTALKVKNKKRKAQASRALENGKKVKFPTKIYNLCEKCGKVKSYMRKFGICRICFRELASNGEIMGVKKSSW